MTQHSPEWFNAVLENLEAYCLANSPPQSEEAIARAVQKAKSESRSEMLDAAMAVSAARAMKAALM
ncbi:MAG: hypothetical protein ABJF50_08385 [Paracoccaceae bacterium]